MQRALVAVIIGLALACNTPQRNTDKSYKIRIPQGFPQISFPEGNEPTVLRIKLGRLLFYDNRLSATNTLNCGSCHIVSAAFTDGRVTSPGMTGKTGRRNAPTLANLAWMPRFMMEGGVPTLETQALAPLHDSLEMGMNMMFAVAKLNQDEELKKLAKQAYGRDSIDPYVVTRALAAFQRTFVSGDTRYDRYINGQHAELNDEEIKGMELFFSENTNCGSCHKGVFLSDFDYHNIGLYEVYEDKGKALASWKEEDIGKFKTPTLRNIALTAPYMHDGSLNTLDEVIEFYNSGGKENALKDARIRSLNLSAEEQKQLLAFLKTITDWNFVQNAQFLPLEK